MYILLEADAKRKIANISNQAIDSPANSGCLTLPFAHALQPARIATLRALALGTLLASVTLDHYTLDVAGFHVKAEHAVILALIAVMICTPAYGMAKDSQGWSWRRLITSPLAWIAPYVGVTLLASLFNALDWALGVRHTAMIALIASGAWLAYRLTDSPQSFRLAVKLTVAFGLLEAAYTFLVLAASRFGSTLGAQPGNGKIVVPYGTLWEPNILGSYLAASGVLLLAALITARNRRVQAGLTAGLGFILAALGLSLARAAWLGFAAGALVVLLSYAWLVRSKKDALVEWRRAILLMMIAVVGAVAFLGGVAPTIFPTTAQGILVRINPNWYDPAKDPSVRERVDIANGALDGIAAHPIIGNGAGSYGMIHTGAGDAQGWISNLELHILYDSGVLGLSTLLFGLGLMVRRAWRAINSSSNTPDLRPQIVGLLGALAVLLVAFQATEGTWLAFTWVYIGLLARAGNPQ